MAEVKRGGVGDGEISGAQGGAVILRSFARIGAANKEQLIANNANNITVFAIKNTKLMRGICIAQHAEASAHVSDTSRLIGEHKTTLHLRNSRIRRIGINKQLSAAFLGKMRNTGVIGRTSAVCRQPPRLGVDGKNIS